MDLVQRLAGVDFTQDLGAVIAAIKAHLGDLDPEVPVPPPAPTLLVGGGSGTPTTARALRQIGLSSFTVLANSSDLTRDPRTRQPIAGGLVKVARGALGQDWADTLKQLIYPYSPSEWSVNARFLEGKVGLYGFRRGYLIAQALAELEGPQRAIARLGWTLQNTWQVLLTTTEKHDVRFRVEGQWLDLYGYCLDRVDKSHIAEELGLAPRVRIATEATQAIRQARTIILGPGDFHFSLVPHFLIHGFRDALLENPGSRIVLVANLTARDLDIPGFTLERFLNLWDRHLPEGREVWVLVNGGPTTFANPLVDDVKGDQVGRFRLARRTLASTNLTYNKQPQHSEEALGKALQELLAA